MKQSHGSGLRDGIFLVIAAIGGGKNLAQQGWLGHDVVIFPIHVPRLSLTAELVNGSVFRFSITIFGGVQPDDFCARERRNSFGAKT